MKVKELKEILSKVDDDFEVDLTVRVLLNPNEFSGSYQYPYDYRKAQLEFWDVGFSDKIIKMGCDIIR
jgi:hypothetical protein